MISKSLHNNIIQVVTKRLQPLAQEQNRPLEEIVIEAMDAYIDLQRWQIEQVKNGIISIENNERYTHKEVFSEVEKRMEGKVS